MYEQILELAKVELEIEEVKGDPYVIPLRPDPVFYSEYRITSCSVNQTHRGLVETEIVLGKKYDRLRTPDSITLELLGSEGINYFNTLRYSGEPLKVTEEGFGSFIKNIPGIKNYKVESRSPYGSY